MSQKWDEINQALKPWIRRGNETEQEWYIRTERYLKRCFTCQMKFMPERLEICCNEYYCVPCIDGHYADDHEIIGEL